MPIKLSEKKTRTNVAVLIDSSGSMQGLSKEVVANFNEIVKSMKTAAKDLDQEVKISLYTFGGTVDTVFADKAVGSAPLLKASEYKPDGGTPMFNAMRKAIDAMVAADEADVANIVTVITDGEENTSFQHNVRSVPESIKALQSTDRWTFTFLVPPGNEEQVTSYGVPARNVQAWEATKKGMKKATKEVVNAYANYLSARSTGQLSSKGFFLAKMDATKAAAVKRNLKDVQASFYMWRVPADASISDEIFRKGHTFRSGSGFYELTKPEKVQAHKEVLMREKKTGKIYGGADARSILGLPDGIEVKVTPGSHPDWEIYVQSTSNNRKLIAGTSFLYLR